MSKNVGTRSLGRPIPDAQRPRNPFDRSTQVKLNQKTGHAIPAHWSWIPAGSHVKINRKEFMRTFNIITSSFVPFNHYIDFFAVKISDVWSYWDNWYLNINDHHSSFGNAIQAFESSGSVAIDEQVHMRQNLPAYSMFSILTLADQNTDLYPGTGELSYPNAGSTGHDGLVIAARNRRRLAHHLRYPISPSGTLDSSGKYCGMTPDDYGYVYDKSNQVQNLIPACVYQKICAEWYRNTSYKNQNPFHYNLDWLGSSNGSQVTQTNLCLMFSHLFDLQSVNWRKDFYQSAYPALDYIPADQKQYQWSVPDNIANAFAYLEVIGSTSNDLNRWSPLGSDAGSTGGSVFTSTPSWLSSRKNLLQEQDGVNVDILHDHSVTSQQSLAPNAYNVQAIRAAFALDKLRRATAYASQHIKDQYEARFGFKFKGDQHHSIRIGSFKCQVTPFEVTSTSASSANGSLQPLGTIGGKGLGSCGYQDEISFDAKDGDYIIMAISYFVPELSYDSLHHDPFLVKHSRNDFFQPEFENLGLQPVYQKLISWSTLTDPSLADVANNILRFYQTRYQEYKTDINRNFGLFNRGCMLSPFTSHFNLDMRVFGMSGLDWRFFKVLPSDVDNMFVTESDDEMLSDHFYGVIDFDIKCTQLMSVHGQPDL